MDIITSRIFDISRPTDFDRQFVFSGEFYKWFQGITMAGLTTLNIQILTSAISNIHFRYRTVNADQLGQVVTLSENATFIQGVTKYQTVNLNQTSSMTSTLSLFSDSTLTGAGTLLENYQIGSSISAFEIILKRGTSYNLQIQNLVAATCHFIFNWIWYEDTAYPLFAHPVKLSINARNPTITNI